MSYSYHLVNIAVENNIQQSEPITNPASNQFMKQPLINKRLEVSVTFAHDNTHEQYAYVHNQWHHTFTHAYGCLSRHDTC